MEPGKNSRLSLFFYEADVLAPPFTAVHFKHVYARRQCFDIQYRLLLLQNFRSCKPAVNGDDAYLYGTSHLLVKPDMQLIRCRIRIGIAGKNVLLFRYGCTQLIGGKDVENKTGDTASVNDIAHRVNSEAIAISGAASAGVTNGKAYLICAG